MPLRNTGTFDCFFSNNQLGGLYHWTSGFSFSSDYYVEDALIDPGVTINTNGFRLYVKNTITFSDDTSILTFNGNDGQAGNLGGAGGAPLPAGTVNANGLVDAPPGGTGNGVSAHPRGVAGGPGGDGGAGSGGIGGLGGAIGIVTPILGRPLGWPFAMMGHVLYASYINASYNGGSSGGGGAGNGVQKGGGAGSGAGLLYISAKKIDMSTGGTIRAIGGAGGAGGTNNCGGGGGGGGGAIVVACPEILVSNPLSNHFLVYGGDGGAAGGGSGLVGQDGFIGNVYYVGNDF